VTGSDVHLLCIRKLANKEWTCRKCVSPPGPSDSTASRTLTVPDTPPVVESVTFTVKQQLTDLVSLSKARWLGYDCHEKGVVVPQCWIAGTFKKFNVSNTVPKNACSAFIKRLPLLKKAYPRVDSPGSQESPPEHDEESDTSDEEPDKETPSESDNEDDVGELVVTAADDAVTN
jgi:hypothetical protein